MISVSERENTLASVKDFIIVGKVGRTRGVEGELFITTFTDFPDRFLDLDEIFVKERGEWTVKRLKSSRLVGERPVISFEGIDNREEAARLTNMELAVSADNVVLLPNNTYYIFDLVGCDVFDELSNKRLGVLKDVQQLPASDLYVIKTENGGELLVPVLKKFVKSVDTEKRRIVIDASEFQDDSRAETKE